MTTHRTTLAAEFLQTILPEVNWASPHMHRTPERFVNMLRDLAVPRDVDDFDFTVFDNKDPRVDEMVIVKNIPFASFCAHHIIPFVGHAWVAYLPEDRIVGLSKIARTVKYFSKGLWVQEELNNFIATYLDDQLDPKGVAVVMQAEHMCMSLRGVQSNGSATITSSMRGVFLDTTKGARQEFLNLIRKDI